MNAMMFSFCCSCFVLFIQLYNYFILSTRVRRLITKIIIQLWTRGEGGSRDLAFICCWPVLNSRSLLICSESTTLILLSPGYCYLYSCSVHAAFYYEIPWVNYVHVYMHV